MRHYAGSTGVVIFAAHKCGKAAGQEMQRETSEWRAICRDEGIDTREVQLIFERYDAYRQFTQAGAGEAIPVETWFRFYHREKASEGVQAGPAPGGCSAEGDAVNNACLRKPAEFLRALVALAAERAPAG